MFADLGGLSKIEFLQASSAEGLKKKLKAITLPTEIISFYSMNGQHYVWIKTEAKITKIERKQLNG